MVHAWAPVVASIGRAANRLRRSRAASIGTSRAAVTPDVYRLGGQSSIVIDEDRLRVRSIRPRDNYSRSAARGAREPGSPPDSPVASADRWLLLRRSRRLTETCPIDPLSPTRGAPRAATGNGLRAGYRRQLLLGRRTARGSEARRPGALSSFCAQCRERSMLRRRSQRCIGCGRSRFDAGSGGGEARRGADRRSACPARSLPTGSTFQIPIYADRNARRWNTSA